MKKNNQQIGWVLAILAVIIVIIFMVMSQQNSNSQVPTGGGQQGTVAPLITSPSQQSGAAVNPDQSG